MGIRNILLFILSIYVSANRKSIAQDEPSKKGIATTFYTLIAHFHAQFRAISKTRHSIERKKREWNH